MIKLDKVSKKFGTGVFGLSDISLLVDKGEFVFLVGPTGSGKTTILKLLIRDILPTEGDVTVSEFDVVNISKNNLPVLRKKVGVIFQDLKLLFDRTVSENVLLPLEVSGKKPEEALRLVEEVLEEVDLLDHKDKFPVQLSGGELQRVAIARALVLSPEIILADEPTGNLDNDTSWEIVNILTDINKKGTTIIMATHNEDIIKTLDKRVVYIEKGRIVKDEKGKKDSKKHKEEKHKEADKIEDKDEKQEKKEEDRKD